MLITLSGAGASWFLPSLFAVGAGKTIAGGTAATLPYFTSAGTVATAAPAVSAPSASALGGSAVPLAAGAASIPGTASLLTKGLGISFAAGSTAGASTAATKIAGGTKGACLVGAATTSGGSGAYVEPSLPLVVPGPPDVAGAVCNLMADKIGTGLSKAVDARYVLPPTGKRGLLMMCGGFFREQPVFSSRVTKDETVCEETAEC
ncbi:hypothetical protein TGARI_215540 [Toxoplasma gondii ARI]|uniref:Uncharacterized protein n=2 Tax=Toxoplasma gondii TaxID=5811 RepID=A0A2G8XVX6_TOXGO|nr:hypothetical protein TGARI_215540 [Toxoplasma gondii ARI]PIL99165.1 hypothetical protein TGCOUG_215540 [Toxoplasma gondii COUG]